MREAYPAMQHVNGWRAHALLREFLDGDSWEALQWIWDNYPDHVVELSSYPFGVGVLRWNTLFWDVRVDIKPTGQRWA